MINLRDQYDHLSLVFRNAAEYAKYRQKSFTQGASNTAKEFYQYTQARSDLKKEAPQGDGHPVLIIPAFTANDLLSWPLRDLLSSKGYKAYAWKGGFNMGMTEKTAKHLATRLEKIYKENGNQKVTIVGHSLGGFYARALAQEFPDMVRAVVTINTPFGVGMNKGAIPPTVLSTIDKLSDKKYSVDREGMAERMLTPPPVPTTSIFSKSDRVSNWVVCLNPNTPLSENIEVNASHLGSIWHKDTLAVILERLSQPEGKWKPHQGALKTAHPPNPNWKPTPGTEKFFPKP